MQAQFYELSILNELEQLVGNILYLLLMIGCLAAANEAI
jgi:hypothetical protein